ncbi:MAG: TolC family protein [Rickettsia endosymbiont of Pentastiridius leporinus]
MFIPIIRLFFLDSRFRGNDIRSHYNGILVLLILSFFLYSCSVKHDKPSSLPLPSSWNNYSLAQNNNINIQQNWGKQFNDPILNRLIEESIAHNSDIELAMNNISAATAQLNFVNSYRFPQINLQGSANRTKASKELKNANQPKFSNNFGLGTILNYELDLWGAAANASESARRTLLANEYSKDAVRLSVISNVTISYFNRVGRHQSAFPPKNRTSELPRIRLKQFTNSCNLLSLFTMYLIMTIYM